MVRCVGKFIIALLLFGLLPASSLAQSESGEIVYRPYLCPYGYADVFYPDTCNMYLPNATANSTLPDTYTMFEGTSDTRGVIFALDPGTYWLHSGIPGDFSVQRHVTCKSNGTAISHPVTVMAGDRIECEQLIFPSSGRASNPPDELDLTLTIRARSRDLPITRSAFHDACFDNAVPDELFYISADRFDAEVTTGADGNASVDVPDFTLEIDPTGELFGARVWRFCSSADHPGVPLLYPFNLLYHSSPVTCDIYFLPETYDLAPDLPDAESGQIEVQYRLCPPGFLDTTYYATCHDLALPDSAIELASESGAVTAIGYTDETGDVTFRVPSGSWVLPPDILGQPEDRYAILCTDEDSPDAVFTDPIAIVPGSKVTCDLYLVPAST